MANGKSLSDFMPSALDRLLGQQSSSFFDAAFFRRPSDPAQPLFYGNALATNAPAPGDNVLTIDKLRSAAKLLKQVVEPSPVIHISDAAVTIVGENFADSRHRSRRVLKKLMRRFGSQHRTKPACLRMGDTLLVHPILWDQMRRNMRQAHDDAFMSALYGVSVRP